MLQNRIINFPKLLKIINIRIKRFVEKSIKIINESSYNFSIFFFFYEIRLEQDYNVIKLAFRSIRYEVIITVIMILSQRAAKKG